MRLMHFFSASKHMGPYVVMIGRMVRETPTNSYWAVRLIYIVIIIFFLSNDWSNLDNDIKSSKSLSPF